MKAAIMGAITSVLKTVAIVSVSTFAFFQIATGIVYDMKINDGVENANNEKNAPAAIKQYISDAELDNDGNIKLSKTPRKLWKELLQKDNRITHYLKTAKEMQALVNSQLGTHFLDTKQKSRSEKSKVWELLTKLSKAFEILEEVNKKVDSTDVNGIVKLKRKTVDGDEYYMEYKNKNEFERIVESGSNNALNYFTLEKVPDRSTYSSGSVAGISGTLSHWPSPDSTRITSYFGLRDAPTAGASTNHGAIDIGATLGTDIEATEAGTVTTVAYQAGGAGNYVVLDHGNGIQTLYFHMNELSSLHVGDTVAKGQVIGHVGTTGASTGPHLHFEIRVNGQKVDPLSYKYDNGMGDGVGGIGSNVVAPTGQNNTNTSNSGSASGGNISSITSCSISREDFISKVQSYQEAVHNGMYTQTFRDNAGVIYDVCTRNNINPVLCAGQAWREGNWKSVRGTRYNFWGIGAYNSTNTAHDYSSMEDAVQRYCDQINSQMDSSSSVYGIYLSTAQKYATVDSRFKGDMSTIYDVFSAYCYIGDGHSLLEEANFAGDYIDSLAKCADQIFGAGSLDITATATSGSRKGKPKVQMYKYIAKIAVPSDNGMNIQTIDYSNYIRKYVMPFNYLWAMLVIGENEDFVVRLANLVYNSDFEITVHDNMTVTTVKKHVTTTTRVEGTNTVTQGGYDEPTTVTHYYTTTIDLTSAKSWIADYEQKYKLDISGTDSTQTQNTVAGYPSTSSRLDPITGERITTRTTAVRTINTNITIYNYIKDGPSETIEKTDPHSDEPNFVSLLYKNHEARDNIKGAWDWLLEILEKNDDTKDMIDLTKYLMYKTTGRSYGVTDFETVWNAYRNNFSSIGGGTSGLSGVQGQVYDFLLSKGVPAVGAAAIMGNIDNESSFNPASVGGSVYGLCQWGGSRYTELVSFASQRGTDWTDVNTQLEFLWKELNSSTYTSVRDIILSADEESELEYATWYWGSYFEIYDLANKVGYEASRTWTEEQERYASAQKWYKEWQEHHTSAGGSAGAYANASAEEKVKFLFPNGIPTTAAEAESYLINISVPITTKSGQKTTVSVRLHQKIAQDVYTACLAAQNEGFKVYDIGGYRDFASDPAGKTAGLSYSQHCYGLAVDINYVENYYINRNTGETTGSYWKPGSDPYSIKPDSALVTTFKSLGWGWGGDWSRGTNDYMHFSFMGT